MTKKIVKPVNDPPLTAKEVAQRLGVSRSLVCKLARSGQLKGYRVGPTAWRFLTSTIDAIQGAK